MDIDRAIEKQKLVLERYCTTREDKKDIAAAIFALEFYRSFMEEKEKTHAKCTDMEP